jgi:hypothetical protein
MVLFNDLSLFERSFFIFGGVQMTEVWKLDNEYYCLYTENKDIMKRIRRYYPDFEIMAEYFKFDKLIGIQYKIPIKRKRSAFRLAKVDQN